MDGTSLGWAVWNKLWTKEVLIPAIGCYFLQSFHCHCCPFYPICRLFPSSTDLEKCITQTDRGWTGSWCETHALCVDLCFFSLRSSPVNPQNQTLGLQYHGWNVILPFSVFLNPHYHSSYYMHLFVTKSVWTISVLSCVSYRNPKAIPICSVVMLLVFSDVSSFGQNSLVLSGEAAILNLSLRLTSPGQILVECRLVVNRGVAEMMHMTVF